MPYSLLAADGQDGRSGGPNTRRGGRFTDADGLDMVTTGKATVTASEQSSEIL
jgi:hypothetical protein